MKDFGLYVIDNKYLKFLYEIDKEVYYNPYKKAKPFVGIIIFLDNLNYFIPIISAKPKHSKLKTSSREHILITTTISDNNLSNKVYKKHMNNYIQILSLIDIKKMIPAPEGTYTKLNFNDFDPTYKKLLLKEYEFCLKNKQKIYKTATNLYTKQKETGVVLKRHCNFTILENSMNNWKNKK
ncbi:Hypothetical protein MYEA_0800 [Mycoplasma yeatsii 13926]|uniref:Type III toxin-antitoxin system ToxN/AbiQ family toxin n=1 Tax=Mycoplasma yeatsii 13926 TaxID=1188240 RepID=S6G941_9MOLU|nr:type III toxin-antitoxin system ToxN/AbiQ family toxin [Mycoplasma yeatsii]EOA07520.1 Hypothetical protein MYEA_0800 [Mycoplasma yeatsii 13926]